MVSHRSFVDVATLIGESSRAIILLNLMDGHILPASELARKAQVTPQTVSAHLAKLVSGGIIEMEAHGRHRYYRIANAEVAQALEGLLTIAGPVRVRSLKESDQLKAMRSARTCYDHLAGALGVEFTQTLLKNGFLEETSDDFHVTPMGRGTFASMGIQVEILSKGRRPLTRKCLDWSERRYHLAGSLGAEIVRTMFSEGWMSRVPNTRAVKLNLRGHERLAELFGFQLVEEANVSV